MSAFDDYLKAAPTSSDQSFGDYLGTTASSKPSLPPAKTPVASEPSLWDKATRGVGLGIRNVVTGVTGLPTMVGNALNTGINYGIQGINDATGAHIPQMSMPSDAVQQGMNAAGLPQAQTGTERVLGDIQSGMASVAPSLAAGGLLSQAASPVTSAIGRSLQAMPGMQLTGAAGSGAGAGIARENGAGPTGQLVAGILGGGLGAVAPSAAIGTARAIAATPENIRGVMQPFTNPQAYVGSQLAGQLGQDAATIAENIRNAAQYVPGSLPTTAQVGATPTLVATEKSLANLSPDFKIGMAAREADNNAARWQALTDVAQTPEALAQAQAARQAAASPLYDAAHANTANVGRGFINFANRPAVQQAMQQADTLARNEGVALKWPTPDDRAISGQALDYTSRALGDMIDAAKRSGNNQQARALADAQQYLQSWTSQYVPGVRQAAAVYAEHSTPVNTMEAGQQIANSLGTRAMGPTGIPQLQLNPYRTALTQAMKGQPYGIDADALASLRGIGQDLQRATISNSLRSPGSDTAYNISANGWLAKQLYGPDFGGASNVARGVGSIGALATGHPMVAGGILMGGKNLGRMAGDRLNAALGQLMLNPEQLLPYLDAAKQAGNGSSPALVNGLGRYVNQGLLGSSVSTRSNP